MPYSTQTNIENRISVSRLLQLADLDGNGTIDTATLDAAIEKADDLIDSHLRGRYQLPLQTVPKIIREFSVDLTVYYLHQARRETISPRDRQSYEDALNFLQSIARGKLGIDIGDAADGISETNLPQTTTPLATHEPVYRNNQNATSNLDNY